MSEQRCDSSVRDSPPAVVMGLSVTGLAVARALGRRGIEVNAVHSGPVPATARSRYLRPVSSPGHDDDGKLLNFYRQMGRRLGRRAVLLPTGDRNVRFVAQHHGELAEFYAFRVCDTGLLEAISSKRDLVAVAERHGLPLPGTILPKSREDLEQNLDRLRFPCVVKPEFTYLWRSPIAEAAGIRGLKALPVPSQKELLRRYDGLARVDPRLVVQEMVIGPDENHLEYHSLIDANGAVRAEFVGRKLRLAPAHYGSGTFVESIHAEDAVRLGRAILCGIGYRGMANLDFKRDARDGRLYLFEINPRFSIWTGLDVACGIDFPYYCYQDALGRPFEAPSGYVVGRSWLNPWDDLKSMAVYARDGTWTWPRWLRSILRFPVNAYFAWDDPGPGLAVGARLARGVAGRWFGGGQHSGRPLDDEVV